MKIFTKKGITQKIILLIIIAILWNFAFPTFSSASIGGILFDPLFDLVVGIGDSVISVLQACLYDGNINFCSGLLNVVAGANYIKCFQDRYPDMKYTGPSITSSTTQDQIDDMATNGQIVYIDEKEFGTVSLYDIAGVLAGGPLAILSGIDIAGKVLGLTKNYNIPTIQYSVDKIFSGKVPAFDINFINPKYSADYTDTNGDGLDDRTGETQSIYNEKKDKSIVSSIQNTIKDWYKSLRYLAIVILLSVLVYIGIRIVISSAADDRAKYKQRLMDWLVAMCLVFFMHYIMAIVVTITEVISDTIGSTAVSIPVVIGERGITSWTGDGVILFNTDLLGLTRLQTQYAEFGKKLIYLILYIALIVYTVKYSWIYMKRTITIMFLTIIAPLVAMTYPIDKMNDGKAQAFNAWLKEYIFTALLQPFHLIIYSVLMGSALKIVVTNPIYAIMVLAFMGPAEKLLRNFFGFDKASSPGMLSQAGAMFGGAAAWNMVKKGAGLIANKGSGKKSGDKGGSNGVRTKDGSGIEDQNAPSSIGDLVDKANNQEEIPTLSDDGFKSRLVKGALKAGKATLDKAGGIIGKVDPLKDKIQRGASNFKEGAKNIIPEGVKNEYSNLKSDLARTALGKRYTGVRNASRARLKEWARHNINLKDARVRKKLGKKALRLAGKAAVTGAVGAVGVGMGIAGDDLEDVLKYGAAGGVLGYSMAPGMGNAIANSELGQAFNEGYGRAVYGSDNDAEVERERQRQFESGEKLKEAKSYYDENGNHYTGEKLTELEERLIEHDLAGISSPSERKKVVKLEDSVRKELYKNLPPEDDSNYEQELQKQNDLAKATAEVAGKVASQIEPKKLNTAKGQDEIKSLFKKEFSNKGLKGDILNKQSEQMLDLVLKYHKKPKM